ncbi:alanine racemase C-terminal domain-containing protein [Latilactobacillus sakei]
MRFLIYLIRLNQALGIESELVFVKQVATGTKIGYGATYEASKGEWIGTIPMGYADGQVEKNARFNSLGRWATL